jgi:uncharacterized protein
MALELGITTSLATTMVLMALAGAPHCAAMCGAPCAAVLAARPAAARWAFHAARLLGYSAAGALLAAGVGQLGQLANASRAFAPLWTLWHALGLLWGLWMVSTARQPELSQRWWRGSAAVMPLRVSGAGVGTATVVMAPMSRRHARGQQRTGVAAAAAAGLAWVAWPCGLLQSALLVASLAPNGRGGALLMALFAALSGLALSAAPTLWRRYLRSSGQTAALATSRATRLAGLMLAAACGWALLDRSGVIAWCMAP